MVSLKQKTVSGIKWLVMNNVLQKVISVGTFAILARILEPSVFGLFAMAFIAIDGLGLFKTFGLDAGVVQRKDSSEEVMHSAFVLIQVMGLVLFAICFSSAPLAAHFFKNAEVGSVLQALGIIFILTGFGRVPAAILTKNLKFRLMSVIDLTASIINCFFAIVFALLSPSVWSLVGAYIIKQVVSTGLTWYFSGYKPRIQFDSRAALELFHYGKYMIGLSILWYVGANLGNTIIGKVLGTAALGYFVLAKNIGDFINTHFTNIISRVMFPAYSAIQDDPDTLKRAYLKTIKFVSMFSLPYSMALISLSEEFVLTLYGEKWLMIVPLIRWLGVIQMVVPILICSGSLFRGCGKPHYDFYLTLAGLLLSIPLQILLTLKWGLFGPIFSGIIGLAIFAPINVLLVKGIVKFRFAEFAAQLAPSLACSLVMLASIYLVKALSHTATLWAFFHHHLAALSIFGVIGAFSYLAAFYLLDRPATTEVRKLLFNFEGRA